MKLTGSISAALVIACATLGLATVGMAQGTSGDRQMKPQPQSAQTKGTQPQNAGTPYAETDEDDAVAISDTWEPVLQVTGIEVMRSTRPPELDIIRVHGVSATEAWEGPELVPLTHTPAPDGILELLLVAHGPSDAVPPTGFGTMEAIFVIEPGHPYKGIRVRGATNSLTLPKLPGYVEAPAPVQDCMNCVGKYFVAKGASLPAGAGSGDVVREEDLPSTLRVIKTSDGVAKLDSDPNRLTLVLSGDGRIAIAVWD
jgi:hypothetical protein